MVHLKSHKITYCRILGYFFIFARRTGFARTNPGRAAPHCAHSRSLKTGGINPGYFAKRAAPGASALQPVFNPGQCQDAPVPPCLNSLPTHNVFRQYPCVNFRDKIIPWERLPAWRDAARAWNQTLVVTNGCFDLLHPGHVTYLEAARNLGQTLLVGLNADAAVRELKGPARPVNSEADRAAVLSALESVDGVCIFTDRTATNFLTLAMPDIYVKGGDYTLETINQDERAAVESAGGKIVILPFVPGKSTTALLKKITAL
jgi:rfaE bifunctional protein nucleotidyltransferase chain/domain